MEGIVACVRGEADRLAVRGGVRKRKGAGGLFHPQGGNAQDLQFPIPDPSPFLSVPGPRQPGGHSR